MRPVGATSFKACHQSIAFQHPPSSRVQICRSFQSSPAGPLSGYNTSAISSMTDSSSSSSSAVCLTCKRCKQQFSPEENHHSACRFHPAIYSGGEVAKVHKVLHTKLLSLPSMCSCMSQPMSLAPNTSPHPCMPCMSEWKDEWHNHPPCDADARPACWIAYRHHRTCNHLSIHCLEYHHPNTLPCGSNAHKRTHQLASQPLQRLITNNGQNVLDLLKLFIAPLQALGFVRKSSAPEDQLGAVMGRTGLMRFWDCCGVEDEQAPGCEAG